GQKLGDYRAGHIGEAEFTPLVTKSQSFVIQAQAMENRRVEVVDVYLVLQDVEPELIGLADYLRASDASSGDQEAEGVGMVVASLGVFDRASALDHRSAPELPSPYDHC